MTSLVNTLQIGVDQNDTPTYSIKFMPADKKKKGKLAINTELTLTVPDNVDIAIFEFTPSGVWVAESNSAITLPGGAFVNTEADLNPGVRDVTPGATLRFISSANTEVGVIFAKTKSTT